jgi:hypothetical protein
MSFNHRRRGGSRPIAMVVSALLGAGALVAAPGPASAGTESFTFTAVADTFVDKANPTVSYGSATALSVAPNRRAFFKFNITGLGGLPVTGARLFLYNKNASAVEGGVVSLADNAWTEAITWPGPALQGESIGNFGPVQLDDYEKAVLDPAAIPNDGEVTLALTTTNSDGAGWSSREASKPKPTLVVDVEQDPSVVKDGISQVAAPFNGSSDPTYFGMNHRLAITDENRLLAVHGRHATGVQLAWRNPGGSWRTDTQGIVTDGLLLKGTGTGDWPASIVTTRNAAGEEHAWAVWSGPGPHASRRVQMRHLSNLDGTGGPTVGPLVEVAPLGTSETGNSKVDIAFERAPDGTVDGVVSWLRKTSSTSWEIAYRWFGSVGMDTPNFQSQGALFTRPSNGNSFGTLESTPTGVAWIGRGLNNKLKVYTHTSGDPLTDWDFGADGISLSTNSYPSAVVLDNGEILAAVESNTTAHDVKVQRFSPNGAPGAVLQAPGQYLKPSIATDGVTSWVVMTTTDLQGVVSRTFDLSGWGAEVVEMDSGDGGNYSYANTLRQVNDRLRFIVRGPSGGTAQTAVLACQRLVTGPPCTDL